MKASQATQQRDDSPHMKVFGKQKKTVAEAFAHRIWDKKDLLAIQDLLHEDIVIHSLLGDFHGRDAMRSVVQAWLSGFPDLKVENTAVISENDLTVIHWQADGTHLGEFKGLKPSGKKVSYAGVTIYRIEQGKIVEYWAYLDMQHIFGQIT